MKPNKQIKSKSLTTTLLSPSFFLIKLDGKYLLTLKPIGKLLVIRWIFEHVIRYVSVANYQLPTYTINIYIFSLFYFFYVLFFGWRVGKKKIFVVPVAFGILNNCTIPSVDRNMVPKLILENIYALWKEYKKNDLDCIHNWI